jgi:hypothetical protein
MLLCNSRRSHPQPDDLAILSMLNRITSSVSPWTRWTAETISKATKPITEAKTIIEDRKTAVVTCDTPGLRMSIMPLPKTIIIDRLTARPLDMMTIDATMTILEGVVERITNDGLPSSPHNMTLTTTRTTHSHLRMTRKTEPWWKSCLEALCLFVEALKHGKRYKAGTLLEPHASAARLVWYA